MEENIDDIENYIEINLYFGDFITRILVYKNDIFNRYFEKYISDIEIFVGEVQYMSLEDTTSNIEIRYSKPFGGKMIYSEFSHTIPIVSDRKKIYESLFEKVMDRFKESVIHSVEHLVIKDDRDILENGEIYTIYNSNVIIFRDISGSDFIQNKFREFTHCYENIIKKKK